MLALNDTVEEIPLKHYLAYKLAQNFALIFIRRNKLILHLNLSPHALSELPSNTKDITDKRVPMAQLQATVRNHQEFEQTKPLIDRAFEYTGGS